MGGGGGGGSGSRGGRREAGCRWHRSAAVMSFKLVAVVGQAGEAAAGQERSGWIGGGVSRPAA